MATDALIRSGGRLAPLSPQTLQRLDAALPPTWSHANPVDIIGDAPAERYAAALATLLDAPEVDAVLLIHAPTAIVPSIDVAQACAPLAAQGPRTVLSCWMGADAVHEAVSVFREAGVPIYATPEEAVRAFLQDMLMETPPATPAAARRDRSGARSLIEKALASDRFLLNEAEGRALLEAYGIPVVPGTIARETEEALAAARAIGYPVVLKIVSPDVIHKSTWAACFSTSSRMQSSPMAAPRCCGAVRSCGRTRGSAGVHVQKMLEHTHGHELIAGVASDPVFGPVILFGHGGTGVERIADRAVALPPLNIGLARQLVSRTRVSRLLSGYRDRPAIDFEALHTALVRLSELTVDLPQIAELDINPLLADERGVCALDARVRLMSTGAAPGERLAIRPYPAELEDTVALDGGSFHVRPIRPEDEAGFRKLLALSRPEDIQSRFFHALREMPRSELARFTQIDYDREMALIALADGPDGIEVVGDARALADPDNEAAEFGVMIRPDMHARGLGHALMERLVRHFRARGTAMMYGDVLPHNVRMLELARTLGFHVRARPDERLIRVTLPLQER